MSKFVDNWMSQRNLNLITTSKSACSCHASWDIMHKQSIYIDYIFNTSKQSTIGNQPQKRKPSISLIQKCGTEPVCLYKVDRFLYSFKSWNVRTEIFNLLILNYMHSLFSNIYLMVSCEEEGDAGLAECLSFMCLQGIIKNIFSGRI